MPEKSAVSETSADEGIRCMLMRGGTSKGAYFLATDLPSEPATRDQLIRRLMGSPDGRQIDGIGGGHPLTSKVAVVSPSTDPRAQIDYLFLQVNPETGEVSDRQNCGNILAGVGQFAVERGLVEADGADLASVRIRMVNTDSIAVASFPVAGGRPVYAGAASIDGVPGTAAPVTLSFSDLVGSTTGALLPTGRARETIAGIEVTCIDNGMPSVLMSAEDLGVSGTESCAELEQNTALKERIETIRGEAGALMGLGDVSSLSIPKMVLLSAPQHGGQVSTRSFIPHRCHSSIGILGAASVAAALFTEGSVGSRFLSNAESTLRIEHPTGYLELGIELAQGQIIAASLLRTARKLFDGAVFG